MRPGLIAIAAAFLLVWGVSAAAAQQWIQTTASDSVLIDGVMYPRASFTVHNRHPMWGFDHVEAYRLAPTSPEDTCRAIRAVAPSGWTAVVGNVVIWWADDPGVSGVPAGGSLGGFQLVLTPGHSACFLFGFAGPIDYVGVEEDCFGGPDQPVSVHAQTWGALKARYR